MSQYNIMICMPPHIVITEPTGISNIDKLQTQIDIYELISDVIIVINLNTDSRVDYSSLWL